MKNQVNFPSGSTLTEEGFDAQMSQQWSNGVTLSGMGRGPMGPGPMGSGLMNPGMENQVPFPPLDFTIPECSKPIHSPMSQQWSEGVTSSGMGRGPMGPGPMGPGPMGSGPMGSGPMGPCPMGNLMAKVNAMKITTNNQTLEQVYAVQTEAARAESHNERARYLHTNFADIDYTIQKAMDMQPNIPTASGRPQYLNTNCAHIDYTMNKAMEMSLNIPTEYLNINCAHIDYTMDKAMEMSLNIPTASGRHQYVFGQ